MVAPIRGSVCGQVVCNGGTCKAASQYVFFMSLRTHPSVYHTGGIGIAGCYVFTMKYIGNGENYTVKYLY